MKVEDLEKLKVVFEYDYGGDNGELCHQEGLAFYVVNGRIASCDADNDVLEYKDHVTDEFAAQFADVDDYIDYLMRYINNGQNEVDIVYSYGHVSHGTLT